MAALVHVRPKSGRGGDTYVSEEWLARWPDDFVRIKDSDEKSVETPAPVGEDNKAAPAVTDAPTGEKEK